MFFEVHRREEVQSAVEPFWVIKVFDVIVDGATGLGEVGEGATVDQFGFESAPERLHEGVIVAIAPLAHAGDNLISGQ